jgi:hypothetical protein
VRAADASVDEVLDWLCMHVEASELPVKLRGRHRGGVTVLRTGGLSDVTGSLENEWAAAEDPGICLLTQFGYSVNDAVAALRACGGEAAAAWALLFAHATGAESPVNTDGASTAEAHPPSPNAIQADPTALAENLPDDSLDTSTAVWLEELVVMQSMYGADVVVATTSCLQLLLELSEDLAAYYESAPASATLVVMHWPASGYPQSMPVFGLRCKALPAAVRVAWVARASKELQAAGAPGAPMLHELVEGLRQSLASPPDGKAILAMAARRQYGSLMRGTPAPLVPMPQLAASQRQLPRRQRGEGRARGFTAEEAKMEGARLQKLLEQNQLEGGERAAMRASREKLPAHAMRRKVLEAVQGHSVTIIAGATGCGKSTQVCFT